jgi:DNA polymerase III subunit delta'
LLEVWLRDVLAVQGAGAAAPLALPDLRGATAAAAAALAAADVLRRVDAVRDAAEALLQNGSPALAVERMLIRWFHGDVR